MKRNLRSLLFALLACFPGAHSLYAAGNDNPTGVTGEYNGSITTAGSYDPYTGNAKRFVTDLTVPGSVGSYPLKWTRVLNTRNGQASAPFGQGGTWSHGYRWGLWLRPYHPYQYHEEQYEGPDGAVSYPDGRTVEFRLEEDGTYVQNSGSEPLDGIEHVGDGNYDLLLPDGGRVKFEHPAGSTSTYDLVAKKIVDPYGQITVLSYDAAGRLSTITEPAGRYLQITYSTYSYQYSWNGVTYTKNVDVISRVEAVVNGQITETVNYIYTQEYVGVHQFYNLTQVNYDGGTHAVYSYFPSDNYSMVSGRIHTCDDVRYAGPMSRIEYEYVTSSDIGGPPDVGQIKREKNLTTGQTVSEVIYPPYNPGSNDPIYYARTERRGDGATRSFQYSNDGNAELKSYTDFQGHASYLSRSAIFVVNGYPRYFKVVTDARGNNRSTEIQWRGGAVMAMIHPGGSSITNAYSNPSYPYHPVSRTDERGNTTYFDRDGSNRVWQTRYPGPNGGVEQFTYNGFGQVLTHTMTNGGVEHFEYNYRGLKTSHTDPLGNVTHYNYHWNDRLQNVVDPYGNATWYDYNQRGQITRVTHQDGNYIENGYNPDGTLAWTSNELRQATTYTYDEYKRVLTATNPLGQTTSTTYAQDWANPLIHTTSNRKAVTLPSGRTTHYAYDENWRRSLVRQAPNTAADAWSYFWYDQVGNLVTTQDPRGYQTNFGYDARNRKEWAMDALSQMTRLYYDAASNVESIQLADGNWETKAYDNMNRVTERNRPGGARDPVRLHGLGQTLARPGWE